MRIDIDGAIINYMLEGSPASPVVTFSCRRLLGWPASASGRLCHGDGGHEGGDCRRSVLKLPTLLKLPPERAKVAYALCGGPREPRTREACSNKCRAALTRRRQAEQRQARARELVEMLDTAEGLHQRTAEVMQMIRRRLQGLR